MSIKVEHLSFGYYKRPLSIVDLNFSFEKNMVVGVLGGDGAGKTSLLSVLSGMEKQFAGKILYDGKPIQAFSEGELDVSLILSEPVFFENKNIFYNLKYQFEICKMEYDQSKVNDILKKFDFEIPLETKVKKLSVNDKKILSLIRSFLKQPKYLFIDNLFVNNDVDDENNQKLKTAILAYINDKSWFKTVFLVDNYGFLQNCFDKIIYLNYGKMTAFNNFFDLKNNLIDLHALNYFDHFSDTCFLAFDGEKYYLVWYDQIKNKKKKIEFKERTRKLLSLTLYEKLSKCLLAPNQELEVVLTSFDSLQFENLAESDINERLQNSSINIFEKNTCVKIL